MSSSGISSGLDVLSRLVLASRVLVFTFKSLVESFFLPAFSGTACLREAAPLWGLVLCPPESDQPQLFFFCFFPGDFFKETLVSVSTGSCGKLFFGRFLFGVCQMFLFLFFAFLFGGVLGASWGASGPLGSGDSSLFTFTAPGAQLGISPETAGGLPPSWLSPGRDRAGSGGLGGSPTFLSICWQDAWGAQDG